MALRGHFQHSHMVVKVLQWLGCICLLSIPAISSIVFFPQPLSVGALKWIQFIQTVALFLLPPLCMAYLWSDRPLAWLQFRTTPYTLRHILCAIVLMIVALPAINLIGYINQQMTLPSFLQPLETWMKTQEENAAFLTEQFLNVSTMSGLMINILLMALLPAVAEELTFRGVLQRLFTPSIHRLTPHIAIWCSAILFSAIHMQFYGFLPRMLMGALFGYLLVWTGSIWVPILMHFTNNAMAVTLYFIASRQGWEMDKVDTIGANDTLWLGVVSIVITCIGIYIFRRSTTISNASSLMSNGN